MSRAYFVLCVDCNERHDFASNHDLPLMRTLIRHRDTIAALVPFLNETSHRLTLGCTYSTIDPSWFQRHEGHTLVPIDEYGERDGKCGERFLCMACSSPHHCKLEKNHEGDHEPP